MIRTPLCDLLDIDVPIGSAGMAGGTARSRLAAAVSEAGGLGGLGGIYREGPEYLRQQIRATRDLTSRPFSVNLWVFLLDVAPQFLDVCIEEGAPSVTLTFGDPGDYARKAKDAGLRVLHQVQTVAQAKRAAEAGVDAIIAQGGEAGGHTGSVATMALVPQAVDVADGIPVIAAGGIADARGVAAARALGASAVLVGTAYLRCAESRASAPHRRALAQATDDATRVTNVFTGRRARSLVNRALRELGPISDLAPPFPLAVFGLAPLRERAESSGSGDFSPLWAGQAAALSKLSDAGELTRLLGSGWR